MMKAFPRLTVSKIYGPTIQTHGRAVGSAAVIVNFSGCNMALGKHAYLPRCKFCDADFMSGRTLSPSDLFDAVQALSVGRLVVLTGGEPLLQNKAAMIALVRLLKEKGFYTVMLETNGTLDAGWIQYCDDVTVSPQVPFEQCEVNWNFVHTINILYPHPNKNIRPEGFLHLKKKMYIQPIDWKGKETDYKPAIEKASSLSAFGHDVSLSVRLSKIIGLM